LVFGLKQQCGKFLTEELWKLRRQDPCLRHSARPGRASLRRQAFFLFVLFLAGGCGSTIRGIGKDVSRVGHGIKMIFVSEESEGQKKTAKPSFSDFFKSDSTAKK